MLVPAPMRNANVALSYEELEVDPYSRRTPICTPIRSLDSIRTPDFIRIVSITEDKTVRFGMKSKRHLGEFSIHRQGHIASESSEG
jgi:hypothetical protein